MNKLLESGNHGANVLILQIGSVVAVFGSSSAAVDASVAGVCDALHVPYISTLTKTEAGGGAVGVGGGLVARIGPSSRHISMAVRDLVGDMSWRDVAVVVHRKSGNCDDDALARSANF